MADSTGILNGSEILVLEDETLLRKRLCAFLEKEGAQPMPAGSVEEARNALGGLEFDYALIDINLPDGEGLDLLRASAFSANTIVVIITADKGIQKAVEAMRLGAADYLAKPFSYDELPLVLERARKARQSARIEEERARKESAEVGAFFFGESLGGLKASLDKIIEADTRLGERLPPALIEGETGVGKTTIARWLHRNGPRAAQPLVEVNASTLPESLAESELFGHERGAFTDAKSARMGLFEAAGGGTIFLDEIGSLSMAVQAKTLTVIEDRRIRRVGGSKDLPVDARLIAASNEDLADLVRERRFREDLYHRLDLLRLRIPPLRERGADILALAEQLIIRVCARYKLDGLRISKTGEKRLLAHDWPGNVRELAHEIERAAILGEGKTLDFDSLAEKASADSLGGAKGDWLNESWVFEEGSFDLEKAIQRIIGLALKQSGGNVSQAARLLGASRDYVRYHMPDSAK